MSDIYNVSGTVVTRSDNVLLSYLKKVKQRSRDPYHL